MHINAKPRRSRLPFAIFSLFNPMPFGFFVAALIFDVLYARTGEMLWMKAAAWLIAFGLILAIIPRLINLALVWLPRERPSAVALKVDFWLNLLAIVAAIFNAFVHSRDAYAVMPEGVWLSALTVILIAVGAVVQASHSFDLEERAHA